MADVILCMEKEHKAIVESFMASEGKTIVTLSIKDEWSPFEPMLAHYLEVGARVKLDDEVLAQAINTGWKVKNQSNQK